MSICFTAVYYDTAKVTINLIHTKKNSKKFGRIKENVEEKCMKIQKSPSWRKGFCLWGLSM